MAKIVRFTKKFGNYNVDQQKKVTDSDAFRLKRLGLAEIVEPTAEAAGTTRALTAEAAPARRRGRPSKAELQRLEEEKESAPPATPSPVPAAAPESAPAPEKAPEPESSGNADDSSAAA